MPIVAMHIPRCMRQMHDLLQKYLHISKIFSTFVGKIKSSWRNRNMKTRGLMHGLDEYDSKARWYYPAICRTTTMDPLAEKDYLARKS